MIDDVHDVHDVVPFSLSSAAVPEHKRTLPCENKFLYYYNRYDLPLLILRVGLGYLSLPTPGTIGGLITVPDVEATSLKLVSPPVALVVDATTLPTALEGGWLP